MLSLSKVIFGSAEHCDSAYESYMDIGELGHDVFMYYPSKHDNKIYLAVADGVGSWLYDGINPVEFPRALMAEIKKIIEASGSEEKSCYDLIQEAYAALKEEHDNGKKHYGTSTFCFVKIDLNSGDTEIANIGDSAFAIQRNNQLIFNTEISQYSHNLPYQIGFENQGRVLYMDCKSKTEVYKQKLQAGDRIILATDGVWDRIKFHDINAYMKPERSIYENVSYIWRDAKRMNRKADDITIILAEVKEQQQQE